MKSLFLLLVFSACVSAQVFSARTRVLSPKYHLKLWTTSVVALAGFNALDVASSVALNGNFRARESNDLLATDSGQFATARAIGVKAGVTAGLLAMEYVLLRHDPRFVKTFSYLNFGFASIPAGAAIHNFRVR